MMPGINPRQMKAAMKKLGMSMNEIEDVQKVVAYTPKGNYVFENVQLIEVKMQGQNTYQLTGDMHFEEAVPEIPDSDIELVASQTSVSADDARRALEESRGDIAEAILKLTSA